MGQCNSSSPKVNADGVWCVELKTAAAAGDFFAKGLPEDITHLRITNNAGLTEIKCTGTNGFLFNCSALTSIDLAPLSKVTTIGYGFLWGCTSLKCIDLAPLSNVTTIGDSFLRRCSLKSVDLAPLSNVTSIGSQFLCDCSSLTSLDLAPLSKVTSVGSEFHYGCSSLTSIAVANADCLVCQRLSEDHKKVCSLLTLQKAAAKKASVEKAAAEKAAAEQGNALLTKSADGVWCVELKAAVSVGDSFQKQLSKEITHLRITNFAGLTEIKCTGNNGLLWACMSLASIDLAPLSKVTTIGYGFLWGCTSLKHIDLAPLSNVTTIGDCFLRRCSLKSIDLAPLSKVTSVGSEFLDGCSSLTSIDLVPLSKVTIVGKSFLYGCTSLKSITAANAECAVYQCLNEDHKKICEQRNSLCTKSADGVWCVELKDAAAAGDSFDKSLSKVIAHLRITNNAGLTEIICTAGNGFLFNCSSLTSIDIAPLSKVTAIGYAFLWGCTSLKHIDLAPLSHVTRIGDSFLRHCSFESVDLAPLSKVTCVGSHFLCDCSSLTSVDLAPLSMVTSVGSQFLYGCRSLKNIAVASGECMVYRCLEESHKKVCAVPVIQKAAAEKPAAEKAAAEQRNSMFTKSADGVWCVELKAAVDAGDSFHNQLSNAITHLRITNNAGLTEIKCTGTNGFLYNCSSLTSIDLAPLSKVTAIGYAFLSGCTSLKHIDLAPLSNVTTIGDCFLRCCSLKSVDLAPLSKVTYVGSEFLNDCSSLTSIDLVPLHNVITTW